MKVFEMAKQCPIKLYNLLKPIVTPSFEIVDFSKDIYYAVKFPHKQLWLVIALWLFCLTAPLYTFLSVFFLNTQEFMRKFNEDLNGLSVLKRIKVKTIRAFREVFQIHGFREYGTELVQKRLIAHKCFVALLEDLPQSVL